MTLRSCPEDQLRRVIEMPAMIASVADAFADLGDGRFELPQRFQLAEGGYLVMPTRHTDQESLVVKAVSVALDRIPVIDGMVSWSSTESPDTVVAPAAPITAIRTGAIVGLATDLMAEPSASSLMLFGAGALAADQIRAVHAVRPLTKVTIVARTPERGDRLARLLRSEMADTRFVVTSLTDRDPAQAEIICCATPSAVPLFDTDELAPTAHVNAVGSFQPGMAELPASLIAGAGMVAVDDHAACMAEAGELIEAVTQAVISQDDLTALIKILHRPPRPQGRTVFKSVGVAVQDWAAMNLLASSLEETAEPIDR